MKTELLLRTFLLGLLLPSLAWSELNPDGKTLEDCYQASKRRSELVGSQTQLIQKAEEAYKQAVGSALPTFSASGSYQGQQDAGSNIFPASQPLVKITATQPLFQGFKEWAAFRQTKNLIRSQEYTRWQVLIQLYQDTASNFYSLISMENDLKNLQGEVRLYENRIEALNRRVQLGRSRDSEVLTTQTQMENLLAQSEVLKTQIRAARETLAFLTGFEPTILLRDDEGLPNSPPDLNVYLRELERRPDILSAQESLKAADENVNIAFGGHLPTLNLTGNYYFLRSGVLKDVSWDYQIALTLPLFSWGVVQSQVRSAEAQKIQTELNLSRTQRLAQQEIKTNHVNLQGDLVQVEHYEKITKLAQKNYQIETQDYQRGLVTNLDVLTALNLFQESKRSLDRAKYSVKLDYMKLEASVAHRPKSTSIENERQLE